MELYFLLPCLFVIYINFVEKITVASQLEHRIAFILCLFLIMFPIVSQLFRWRIKKSPLIMFIICTGVGGFALISLPLFGLDLTDLAITNDIIISYTVLGWVLFIASLTIQDCSILYHCFKYSLGNRSVQNAYKKGLIVILIGLITEAFAIFLLFYYDMFITSGVGVIGHAITILGCLMLRKSANPLPRSNME